MTDLLLKELEIPGWQKILKRYEGWVQFTQFLGLLNSVREGKVTPEEAIKLLVQRARQEFEAMRQDPATRLEMEKAKGRRSQTAT
jgi:hypothetical protein